MASQPKSKKGDKSKNSVPPRKNDHGSECAICLNAIVDRSAEVDGEDSIFCDGACQRWLHRTCAGLTDPAFDTIRNQSDEKFYCYQCFVALHFLQMKELRDSIDHLTKEVSSLKSQLSQAGIPASHSLPADPPTHSDAVVTRLVEQDHLRTSLPVDQPQTTPATKVTKSPGQTTEVARSRSAGLLYDKKFKLVVYGIKESPKGTSRGLRNRHDLDKVTTIVSNLESSITSQLIRDCG